MILDYPTIIQLVILNGGGTAIAIQVLKSNVIPSDIPNKYPKLFNASLSLISSIAAIYTAVGTDIFSVRGIIDVVTLSLITMLSAVATYKLLLKSNNEQVSQ